MSTKHPYASFVHLVLKPARYLSGEYGTVRKAWDVTPTRVCLAFPDIYDIGMSHLGFKILYKILNEAEGVLAERAYCPWIDMDRELRARNLPLVSHENARPLSDFDVVGFSLQFELTYTNILTMLDLGGIALLARDRAENAPLVLAGGPTATHPEPLVDFIDAFVIGDGEERALEIARLWTSLRDQGVSRIERLRALTKIPGVYVPRFYGTVRDNDTGFEVVALPTDTTLPYPIERALVEDLNKFPFPDDSPVGGPEAIFDRMSIEIARGCTEGCRFCQAGMIYRPVRERDPDQIVDTVVSAIKKSGHDEVSLTSLSTADYSCIAPLVKKVVDKLNPALVSLGVSSLRAYGLGEDVMDDMQGIRASGLTFAPEAGSQRMRDVVNKNVTEEQLHQTAERVFARSWNAMKLYFMIGLPTEEEEDVREIVRVGGRTLDIGRRAKQARKQRAPTVTVSVSTHVPKPHTPFQWCAMDPPDLVEKKQAWLREEQQTAKVDLRLHDSKGSWLEGVFARGDRKLGAVLLDAYQRGARFDSWEDQLNLEAWNEAFRGVSIDPAMYLGTLPTSAVLPWNHIDVGLEQGFLEREYRKALSSRLSPPCGKVAGAFVHSTNLKEAESETRRLVCYDCGVACDLTAMREERLVYLRALGAEAPRQRSLEPVPARAFVEKGKAPALIVQGEPVRYRFGFTKLGPAAFLSHLDLIRTLPRVFRRAEIPMFYSSGFHPKPEMVFGPALSLGVGSLREYMDIKLTTNEDASVLMERINAVSEPGLVFFGAEKLAKGDPALSKSISVARYGVAVAKATLAAHKLAEGHESDWLQSMRDAFVANVELVLIRTIDGIGKKVNVREFVTSLSVCSSRPHWADPLGLEGDLYFIEADVEIRGNGSAKISEVMTAAFGDLPYAASRIDLGSLGEPLENGERSVRTPFEVITRPRDFPSRVAAVEPVSV